MITDLQLIGCNIANTRILRKHVDRLKLLVLRLNCDYSLTARRAREWFVVDAINVVFFVVIIINISNSRPILVVGGIMLLI